MRAADLISPSTIAQHGQLHKQPKSFVPVGCLWVIKINRVFLTDLLSLLQAQRSGLPGDRQANELGPAEGPPVPSLPLSWACACPGTSGSGYSAGVGGFQGVGCKGTAPSQQGGAPVRRTVRTPKWGTSLCLGSMKRIRKGSRCPRLGTPDTTYNFTDPQAPLQAAGVPRVHPQIDSSTHAHIHTQLCTHPHAHAHTPLPKVAPRAPTIQA